MYLVGVGHNGLAAHIAESDWEGFFKKCCMSNARISWMICCGMAVKRMGVLGVCEEEEGTDCEDGGNDTDW